MILLKFQVMSLAVILTSQLFFADHLRLLVQGGFQDTKTCSKNSLWFKVY